MEVIEKRYNGLIDQIDFYFWMQNDNGKLSEAQKQHLTELSNAIQCFGDRAEKWVKRANNILFSK